MATWFNGCLGCVLIKSVLYSLIVMGAFNVPGIAKDLTPCDLVPNNFAGRPISVKGSLLFTMHDATLFSKSCVNKGQHSTALMYPNGRGAPPVAFTLESSTLARLEPFFRPTGAPAIACGVFSGQVFYKKGFHLKHFNEITIGNGFGEHGTLRAAFVIRAVSEIHSCD